MLSERMLTNVSFIDRGSKVADIGCDHGFVGIYLIKEGIADKVIAMDVGEMPLERAREHIEEAGLSDRIETRLSDGIKELKLDDKGEPEVDSILIAGMGGRLAIKILSDSIEKAKKLKNIVLQPQSELDYVRDNLKEMGFCIKDEKMTFEGGKYYTTMKVVSGDMKALSEEESFYGPVLLAEKNELLFNFLMMEKEKFTGVVDSIESKEDFDPADSGYISVSRKLERVNKALNYYK